MNDYVVALRRLRTQVKKALRELDIIGEIKLDGQSRQNADYLEQLLSKATACCENELSRFERGNNASHNN